MSLASLALKGFRSRPFNWNCYQAILGAYNKQVKEGTTDSKLAQGKDLDMMEQIGKAYGHGSHPSGRCGALQAVIDLLPPEEQESAIAEFQKVATYSTCEDIRGEDTISCRQCVETASNILARHLKV